MVVNMASSLNTDMTDDLISIGLNVVLSKARTYNRKQSLFSTYAKKRILGAMKDEVRRTKWFKRYRVADTTQMVLFDELNLVFDPTDTINLIIDIKFAMQYLSEREYKVINLRYWYGYKNIEIAKKLGLTEALTSQAHTRALKKLKRHF
jgi:RNA polymerase sigma factor (sigma-70 family)